jgi:hypothetical protein
MWLSTSGSADYGAAGRAHALETPSAMTRTSRAPSTRSFRRARSAFFCITSLPICLQSAQNTAPGTHPPFLALLSRPPIVTLRSRLRRRERRCTSPLALTSGSAVGARRRVVPPPDGVTYAAGICAETGALADVLFSEMKFCLSVQPADTLSRRSWRASEFDELGLSFLSLDACVSRGLPVCAVRAAHG